MFADWMKSIEIAGARESLNALYDSAEVLLHTWERSELQSVSHDADQGNASRRGDPLASQRGSY